MLISAKTPSAVAPVATMSRHQRVGLKRSGRTRQFAVSIAAVAATAWQFMWNNGSGL